MGNGGMGKWGKGEEMSNGFLTDVRDKLFVDFPIAHP